MNCDSSLVQYWFQQGHYRVTQNMPFRFTHTGNNMNNSCRHTAFGRYLLIQFISRFPYFICRLIVSTTVIKIGVLTLSLKIGYKGKRVKVIILKMVLLLHYIIHI